MPLASSSCSGSGWTLNVKSNVVLDVNVCLDGKNPSTLILASGTGDAVGEREGVVVGFGVEGAKVGFAVGFFVGDGVGAEVVGEGVGDGVGAEVVGDGVGEGVGD